LLVILRVVEPLYESTPQLMLQMYVLLLEWGDGSGQWPVSRISSVMTSCFSLAHATTGLVAEHPLTKISPTAGVASARCPGLTRLVFGAAPANGIVEVYNSSGWHPQNFLWAFLLYQWLEIGSRFVSLALLAVVLRAYFFVALLWLWASRSLILCLSLGQGEEQLRFRSMLRLVGMPFMDSVMDTLRSYDFGCALTTMEFVIFVALGNFFYESEAGQAPDNVRRVWTYVAVVLMAGKLVLGFLIVRPFKRVFGFGFGIIDEQEEQSQRGGHRRARTEVGKIDVGSGGGSRGSVRELAGPERRRSVRVQGGQFSSAAGEQATLTPSLAF